MSGQQQGGGGGIVLKNAVDEKHLTKADLAVVISKLEDGPVKAMLQNLYDSTPD